MQFTFVLVRLKADGLRTSRRKVSLMRALVGRNQADLENVDIQIRDHVNRKRGIIKPNVEGFRKKEKFHHRPTGDRR